MPANHVLFGAVVLSGAIAAQTDLPANLGGSCGLGPPTLTITISPSFWTFTVAPPGLSLLVVGFTDPAAPLPGCAPCTLHASLDVLFVMPTTGALSLALPPGGGFTLYAQGVQLGGLGCTTFVPGLPFSLTDGYLLP